MANSRPRKTAASKAAPEPVVEAEPTPEPEPVATPIEVCDNHSDREAVIITDGLKFQQMRLCAECKPASW